MRYTDESIMPFGKYKGIKLTDVPSSYLLFLFDDGLTDGPLRAYIVDNLDVLRHQYREEQINKAMLRSMCR